MGQFMITNKFHRPFMLFTLQIVFYIVEIDTSGLCGLGEFERENLEREERN